MRARDIYEVKINTIWHNNLGVVGNRKGNTI